MIDDEQLELDRLRELLNISANHLHTLKKQEAEMGILTPPHISTQMDSIAKRVDQLQREIGIKKQIVSLKKRKQYRQDRLIELREDIHLGIIKSADYTQEIDLIILDIEYLRGRIDFETSLVLSAGNLDGQEMYERANKLLSIIVKNIRNKGGDEILIGEIREDARRCLQLAIKNNYINHKTYYRLAQTYRFEPEDPIECFENCLKCLSINDSFVEALCLAISACKELKGTDYRDDAELETYIDKFVAKLNLLGKVCGEEE